MAAKTKIQIELTLNEIEVILLLWTPRERQRLGPFADSARSKLVTAQREIKALSPSLFDAPETEPTNDFKPASN